MGVPRNLCIWDEGVELGGGTKPGLSESCLANRASASI